MSEQSQDMDIDYVAELARIELSDTEKERFSRQLGEVIGHFKTLDAIDTEGIEPMAHAFPLENVWGEDVAGPTLDVEAALRNAPKQREQQVVVPKVVE